MGQNEKSINVFNELNEKISNITSVAISNGICQEVADMMTACASFLYNKSDDYVDDIPFTDLYEDTEDDVNHPSHYKVHAMECINEIVVVLGVQGAIDYCKGCYLKYRYRAGNKDDKNKDLAKSDWYIQMAEELQNMNALFGTARKD